MIEPQEVAGKEFLVGMRGYIREDVRVYLRAVAEELFRRDEVISGLRYKLDKVTTQLEEAHARLEEADGQGDVDRATLVRMVGEEASAILSTADGAAERIRFEAARYAEAVRDGLVSTTEHLAALHDNLRRLLAEIRAMEPQAGVAPPPSRTDVPVAGPDGSVPDEISLDDEEPVPEGEGEPDPSWRWIR